MRFETTVVEVTVKGAVSVATVEMSCVPESVPVPSKFPVVPLSMILRRSLPAVSSMVKVPELSSAICRVRYRLMFWPELMALVISASETSRASVITPSVELDMDMPSAVVADAVEVKDMNPPVEELELEMEAPVPALVMPKTEPEAEA